MVASDLDAFQAVSQEGNSAMHFANGDARACAQAIERLLEQPELRSRLAQKGRERAACYDWERVTQQILGVYAQALRIR
ncbi:hypothetical protein KIM372_09510 [Bombiscardovia nodaiensis]|uniref:Uncharacterized protein n=1 Tax=Bombiscardovia nodaiensis TaxID=2932181 RepID=A0ABM8B8D6_9BIFI|nr:hypothetical protein KIM372_09510 [Bombiscardovia nodaiensis]